MFKNQFQIKHEKGVTLDPNSETIPNQDISVNEILQRFQSGSLPNIAKDPIYTDDPDYDDYVIDTNYDITDAMQDLEIIKHNIKQLQEQQKNEEEILKNSKKAVNDEEIKNNEEIHE